MNKIVLVDGNNLLFRSYYATAYSGNFMRNSKGFPTNALLGFANMINKIIDEEKPEYIIVAFDKGKTFRHKKYDFYKGERRETPDELKIQFPIAKDMLDAMGITYYEIDNYEADDIIGTFAKYCDDDPEFIGTIVSSDKDLLQLISSDIDIKLLKQKDYIRYDLEGFKKEYGIDPINIIDLKALMGDASDNIPGVKGVGEKTALKLLREYKTIDNLYNHIDEIKGKLKDKLVDGKKDAYMSYEIATIVKTVPMDITMSDLVYKGINEQKLIKIYDELEF
jgi:DNA polymerase-1